MVCRVDSPAVQLYVSPRMKILLLVARAGGSCMKGKSLWVVVCVIHMLLARMMLAGEGRIKREKNQDVKQL